MTTLEFMMLTVILVFQVCSFVAFAVLLATWRSIARDVRDGAPPS